MIAGGKSTLLQVGLLGWGPPPCPSALLRILPSANPAPPLQVVAAEVMKEGDESLLADEMGGLLDAVLKVWGVWG